ncbi:GNAT family N-acetyltransferase [Salinibacterium sp. NK8237]|uniref:GNAT family N-acetyltransferase n=1 Tax=Salinibacterium sp. NK8237 TaxID=2792038 RepID=UPI0018CF5C8E|nr:GNAT family N-acetyltransferase [Salinibacterium sp. NK8237]MBH0129471.1 GNAT family N-acetyltransferase [Salinibacterium sp. NK8237]
MTDIAISPLDIPVHIDPSGSDEFCQAMAVRNHLNALTFGTADTALDPAEELPRWQPTQFESYQMLVATDEGHVIGRGDYETTDGDDGDTAWLGVYVHPEYQRRGIGSRLLTEVEALAIADDKRQAHVYAPAALSDGTAIDSPTGFGSIPRDSAETRFMLAHGYSFEQVERVSRLPLPLPGLHSLVDRAIDHCTRDYAVHEWAGHCPERWVEDYALLYSRMNTDAPSAGLEPPADVWTTQRIRENESRLIAGGLTPVVAAVEHVATGSLVGFTGLNVPERTARAITQGNTIVLREHRGHRLGNLLKVLNLAHLQRVAPGHPSIVTYNAEENRHMLAVNEAVGFVPVGYEGVWKKELR